ncbi:effector-associated constant component EACC1 [Streptomyces gilvosporeus]|uniref:Uncharacterized protein n=1 Tax=Streptomyces gilvosporeus TaxID=553510 RepID=A0A1V0TLR7_9ACTN|nr:hypothetical protein [Streptomyces gilvosporeus]ARF53871.1 hypothetical protein B1H19_06475 [Streptomyces gilvosporeus]
MQVDIAVDAQADGESDDRSLTSLYRWLGRDPEVVRHAQVSLVPRQAQPGDMGDAFEVINAVVANAIALGGLVVACATWRGSRSAAPPVRIERDGVTITVEDGSPESVHRIVAALARGDQDGDEADGDGRDGDGQDGDEEAGDEGAGRDRQRS